MSNEAMKLALELLKTAQNNLAPSKHSAHVYGDGELWDEYAEAIKALEEALSKQEQGEPVARPCHVFNVTKNGSLTEWEPTTMAFALPDGKHALFTESPQQRTWIGLSTNDWDEINKQVRYNFEMTTGEYVERVSHLVEDKLKELNT